MMDWNTDIMMNVIQFLNVRDCSMLSQTASRYFYLVRQYQTFRGPELVACASHDPAIKTRQATAQEVCRDAVSKIQTTPNLAMAFTTSKVESLGIKIPSLLPKDVVIMETVAEAIQSSGIDQQGSVECKSHASLMLASLPHATIYPFCFEGAALDTSEEGDVAQCFNEMSSREEWKVFLVNVAGSVSGAENFVTKLQSRFPEATILGGFCLHGAISMPAGTFTKEMLAEYTTSRLLQLYRSLGGAESLTGITKGDLIDIVYGLDQIRKYRLLEIDEGVFGIALAGQVPFRSVVSRGVSSLIHKGPPQASTTYFVESADIVHPSDDAYMFRGEGPPSYHLIKTIRNQEDGKLYSPIELMVKYGKTDMVGVRRENDDGFELQMPHPVSLNINGFLFFCDGHVPNERPLVGANIDLFALDGEACCSDVDRKMKLLEEETASERVLGAIMISCSGRGPMPGGIINEEMGDAKRFAKVFPNVPCLGFYANGEIGPMALAGRRSIFQTGSACVQGFTAVFALFIVPTIDLGVFELDDSVESVRTFLMNELQG